MLLSSWVLPGSDWRNRPIRTGSCSFSLLLSMFVVVVDVSGLLVVTFRSCSLKLVCTTVVSKFVLFLIRSSYQHAAEDARNAGKFLSFARVRVVDQAHEA